MSEGNVYIADSRSNGKGVFVGRDFKENEVVEKFCGKLFTPEEVRNSFSEIGDRFLQIAPRLYLGPCENHPLDFINHSCAPNAGIKIKNNEAFLMAIKNINIGEEVVFDYSTTMNEDEWELFNCNCGSENCRGRIRDFKYLPDEIKEKYAQLGIVPEYNLVYVSKSINSRIASGQPKK